MIKNFVRLFFYVDFIVLGFVKQLPLPKQDSLYLLFPLSSLA